MQMTSGGAVAPLAPAPTDRPRRRSRLTEGGTDGNERLTSLAGAILVVLLAVLGITIIRIGQLIWVHLFVGLVLLGPLAVKMASTGYRFVRYYTHDPAYRSQGPPEPLMRWSAPMVVASTVVVFGSGILLLAEGPSSRDQFLTLHKLSFIIWLAFTSLHVMGHLPGFLSSVGAARSDGELTGASPGAAGALDRAYRRACGRGSVGGGADPAVRTMDRALRLPSPPPSRLARAALAAGCALVLGAVAAPFGTAALAAAGTSTRSAAAHPATAGDPLPARLGLPPLKGRSALPGYLMIADRDNNRLIIVNPRKQIVRRFPALPGPDDAFVSANRRYVSTNEEFSETITVLTLSRHPRIVWRYGHQGVQGSSYGYLAHPDDAYLLANGQIQVADIINCRVLWINHAKQIVRSLGHAGDCGHDPPRTLSSPNGDTPLPDGGVLVTEIGGWIDRISASGKLLWSIRSPTDYPSDAQLLPNGRVLVAAYNSPGRIDVLGRGGRIVWTYGPASGPGALDHPSLAVKLPNGMIAATDDFHHRVVVIDMRTKRIAWQYGHDGSPGSGLGYLRNPDGLDLIP